MLLLYVASMTKAYVLIDPLTGRPIEEQSPSFQEIKSEQQFFDEQSQSFDEQGIVLSFFENSRETFRKA